MFPWIYEFHWTAGHLIFLGIFFSVAAVIALSVVRAFRRSSLALRDGRLDAIRWRADFADMPEGARRCRHELTGEVRSRVCPHAFSCGECELHPVLVSRSALPEPAERTAGAGGVRLPLDRFYHRSHSWVREEEDGTCTMGLDALAARIIGSPDRIVFPAPGTFLRVNSPACTIYKGGRAYRVHSPVDGVVIGSRHEGDEWFVRLKPGADPASAPHLLRGGEVRPWLLRELERIENMVNGGQVVPTLADGGELLPELGGQYTAAEMDDVRASLLMNG